MVAQVHQGENMLRVFPLLLISVIIYNVVALGLGLAGHLEMQSFLADHVTFHMFSGDPWNFSFGDFLILFSLVMLFFEVIKATRTSRWELLNHGFSALTFVIALVEFITLHGFSTSVFFFIMVMAAIDVVGGYTISIVAAEHDMGVGRAGTD
jgi:hypothetical protein